MHQNYFQSEYLPKLEANFKSNQVSQIQQIVIEMLENLANYCPSCEKKQYEESLKISTIHQQETKKQSKQDDQKKQDKKNDKSIEKTDNKNQQLLSNLSESCSMCTSKQKYFSDTVLQLLTGVHPQITDQIQNEQQQQQIQKQKMNPTIQALQVLKQIQNLGQIKQTFCGKILTRNDIGFKCYDCEMDNTCIICKDCFEKGNHKGHRVYQQQGCQGMCDCGDIEAWKKEGFCSDHQGFIQEDKINLNELPEQFRNNFFVVFGEIIYQVVYLVEQFQKWKLKDISKKNLNRYVQSHPRISNIIEFLFATLDMILGKSMLLTALIQKFLNSQFQDFNSVNNLPFTVLQHNCQDISNNNNLQIDEKISQQCSCTILDLIFRYNMAFDSKIQRKIEEFFITKLFTLYTFKQQIILAYTKNFNFFLLKTNEKQDQQKARLSESNIENDVPQIYVSKVMSMAVQLFTSDELALLAIESQYYDQIFIQALKIIRQCKGQEDNSNNFWQVYTHLRYSIMKPLSCTAFLNKKNIFKSITSLLAEVQYGGKFHQESAIQNNLSKQQMAMQMIEVESGLSSLVANVIERLIIDKQFKDNINQYVVQWMKEILKKINETETQFQKMEIRASTINIPLHRTLAQLIFIFFNCSLDNIQNTNMINQFYTQTGFTQQEFYNFLRKNIIQPLQCFSFTKEIERKLWVHNTEYIKTVSVVYFQARTGFYNQDMLFLQIAILFSHQMENSKNFVQNLDNQEQMQIEETKLDNEQIQQIQEENQTQNQQSHFKQEQDDQGDQNKIINDLYSEMLINFSNKQEWKKIVTDKLDINSVTDKQYVYDKYEKYLFLITDFFYLTNFLLVDEISSFNVFAHFFREEEDEEIVNKYQSSWKNIAIAFMQQYNFQDLQSIKNQLVKNYMSDKVKIKDEIVKICDFNKKNKKFQLKEEYKEYYIEPILFYQDNTLFSTYLEQIHQKYSKDDEKYHYFILGNKKENFKIKKYLQNINNSLIGNGEFVHVLSLLKVSQIFTLGFKSNKIQYINSFLTPLFKQMHEYLYQQQIELKNQGLYNYQKWQYKISLDCFKNIEEFLNYLKNNSEYLNPDNLFLQKYLLGQMQSLHKKIYIQKDGQQEQEQQGDDIENLDQLKMIKQKSKEEKKKKQLQLLNKFKQKSQNFYNKNAETLSQSQLTVDTEESRKCVICKDDLVENFGYQAYMTKTNLHQYSKYQTFQKIARNQEDKNIYEYLNQFQDQNSQIWNLKKGQFQVSTCHHLIHKECYLQYIQKQKQHVQNEYEFFCPFCKRFSSIFVNEVQMNFDNKISALNQPNIQIISINNQNIDQIQNNKEYKLNENFDFISFFQCQQQNKNNDICQQFLSLLVSYIDQENLQKDQEFLQIGIGYDKYNQQISENQKKEQFESIQHFIANVQNINIVEFESQLETDYEILEIIEGMYKNCINTIDLLDLQYFYKEQMELYRNIYNIYLIFFQNYESKLKGPYLFQKLTYIANLVNSLNNQSQSKKYTKCSKINTENIIFNDVDQLLINYMTYSGMYFREFGQQINNQMFLCLLFVKIQQMRIAFNDKQELNNQSLYSYFFKEEKYLRVLINMVKKYIAHLLLTQSLKKQGNYKIIVEYEQEFEYLVEEAGFNQQKIIEFFNQNIEMIRSWEINMNLPEAIEQNKVVQKNILDFKEKQKQDLLQFLQNLRKKQSEDNISQKRKKKSSDSSISSQKQKYKQQQQSQQSVQDMEEEESEEIFEGQQQNQQQQNQQQQQQQIYQQINQNEGQIQQEQLEEEDWEDLEEEDSLEDGEEEFEDEDDEEEYFEMEGDSDSEEEDVDLEYLQVGEEGQGQEFLGFGENGQEEGKNQEEIEMAEKQKQQEKIQEKQFLEYKQEQEGKKMHKKYLPLLLSVENIDFQLFDIENKFGDLTQIYMNEKCSVCKDFPKYQELCLCLICGSCQCSITCENQFKPQNLGILNKHSIEAHCGSSVFLSLKTGKIYLVKHPMNFLDEYLYYDQYGQFFKKNSKDWNDFYLDTEIFNNLKKMVVKNAISQNICYYQTKYDKYYKNGVF